MIRAGTGLAGGKPRFVRMMMFMRRCLLFPFLLLFIIRATGLAAESGAQDVGPQFTKRALLNGLELFFFPTAEPRADFVLMIKHGAAFDPADKWGATYLMARLMTAGTERRSGPQLQEDLASMGAEIQVQVGWDAIFFYGSAPRQRVGDALSVLAEMVVRPKFEDAQLEEWRRRTVQEVAAELEKPTAHTQTLFMREIFSPNPYGHGVKGNLETLQNVTLTDIKIQYRRLVMPNQAQLALYSGGDISELFSELGRRWGSWVRGEPAPFTFRRAERGEAARIFVLDRPEEECLMRFGVLGVEKGAPDFYPLAILEHYITLSLPEWAREISGDRQIQASVEHQARKMPGFLQVSLKVPTPQAGDYVRKVVSALDGLARGEVEPSRFREARDLAFLQVSNARNDSRKRLFDLLESNLYELGMSHLTNYGLRLDRVRETHFAAAVKRYFPAESYLLIVSGKAEELEPQLRDLGTVTMLN